MFLIVIIILALLLALLIAFGRCCAEYDVVISAYIVKLDITIRLIGIPILRFQMRPVLDENCAPAWYKIESRRINKKPIFKKKTDKRTGSLVRSLVKHAQLSKGSISGALGIPDNAALTANLCCIIQESLRTLIMHLSDRTKRERYTVHIEPVFTHGVFFLRLDGIVSMNIRHIIPELLNYIKEDKICRTR